MASNAEAYILAVMSGRRRGAWAGLLRAALAAVEPFYAGIVTARNALFDRGVGVKRLPRPVISVGNITAGGTGKTPVVRWICEKLRAAGHHPAILTRGYKSSPEGHSDEATLLDRELNANAGEDHRVIIEVNPRRFVGAQRVLAEHPNIDVFVMDDGFQHRKLHRDFDLVLIDAANPFGFGHVHPRGLLREPPSGLKRAHAMVITRADQIDSAALGALEQRLRKYNPAAPIYRANHVQTAFVRGQDRLDLPALANRSYFAFCGIGNPTSFLEQLQRLGGRCVGERCFGDHHAYTPADMETLYRDASACGAEMLVTTGKDFAKIGPQPGKLPIWRAELEIRFREGDESKLLAQVGNVMQTQPIPPQTF